jgi:hypothetical protein
LVILAGKILQAMVEQGWGIVIVIVQEEESFTEVNGLLWGVPNGEPVNNLVVNASG